MESPPILSLPDDLMARILDALDDNDDRKAWRVVCTDFLRVDSLRRSTVRVLRPDFLIKLLRRNRNITVLDLSLCPGFANDVVVDLMLSDNKGTLSWTQRVRSLVLSRATWLKPLGLKFLAALCPRLETVDLSYCCGFGDREAAALSCAGGLKALKLDKWVGLTDVGLANIAVRCCRLEILSLKWCVKITDLGLDLVCMKCTELKSLDISFLKVTNESMCSIATLQKLEALTMVGCASVDCAGLGFIGEGCPSLQVLDITRCDLIKLYGIDSVIRGHNALVQLSMGYCSPVLSTSLLHWVKNLGVLKSLRIDWAQVSDTNFSAISSNCKVLEEIGLSKCVGVTDTGIKQLVIGCVNLKIIDLTCCHFITDVAISAIASSCAHLKCLKLESCNLITETGLYSLGSLCSRLEELDLTDCAGVSDRGLGYLSRCSELLCLRVGLCKSVSDRGLRNISSNCKKLQELDLYRCTGIGTDGLHALSIGCNNLKKLNLSYCNKIRDTGVQYLSNLQHLSVLELRGLADITCAGMTPIVLRCTKLAELDLKFCKGIGGLVLCLLAYYSNHLRQINISHCAVTDEMLQVMLSNLMCLQDIKLVHVDNISVKGLEVALRASSGRLKKVKLLSHVKYWFSPELLENLEASGCKFRWD